MILIFLWLLSSVLVSPEGSLDSSPAAAPSDSATSEETEPQPDGVGTVAELQGEARAASEGSEERSLAEGDPVYLNEIITTGPDSSVQIELADESLFSISAETSVRLDKFVYDEEAKDGDFAAYIAKGIFRFITGKIAQAKPEKVLLNLPSGTIGIRGTTVVGEIVGERCLVSLEAEEGDKIQHRIIVSNTIGEQLQEIEITQPGFATVIEALGKTPTTAFRLPEQDRSRFQERIPPPKFLPRDTEGRAQHNQRVRGPRGDGSNLQDQQNRPGRGPKDPNAKNSEGREGRREGRDERKPFDGPPPGGGPGSNESGNEFSPQESSGPGGSWRGGQGPDQPQGPGQNQGGEGSFGGGPGAGGEWRQGPGSSGPPAGRAGQFQQAGQPFRGPGQFGWPSGQRGKSRSPRTSPQSLSGGPPQQGPGGFQSPPQGGLGQQQQRSGGGSPSGQRGGPRPGGGAQSRRGGQGPRR